MRSRQLIYTILFFTIFFSVQAQNKVIKIWSMLAPEPEDIENKEQWRERRSVTNVYQPDLTVFLAESEAELTPAVVMFPRGGYSQVVMVKDGYGIAAWHQCFCSKISIKSQNSPKGCTKIDESDLFRRCKI